jgi:hypothetical protein
LTILTDLKHGFYAVEDEFKKGKYSTMKLVLRRLEELRDGVLVKELASKN